MNPRTAEALICAALGVAGIALALATPRLITGYNAAEPYYLKSALFPWIALGMIGVFGLWGALQAWHGIERVESDEIDAGDSSIGIALGGALIFALYAPLAMLVGYAAAVALASFALGRLVGLSTRLNLGIAAGLSVLLHVVFVAGFKVWFPASLLSRAFE